ncbi:hypothetical protein BIY21_14030 [Vibrio ponticus]|uniref:Uncharacterized protein n=1 Tax=Vibrio ponticus TaxID=265668 RepID=A0ABX3FHG4_9VIBR|nr:hypothetical protein [Vibrio ponticus]OLQ90091.1 hypothetical protein BIY21_14030 [Vibrio ponticus]
MKHIWWVALCVVNLSGCATTPINSIAEFGMSMNQVSQQIDSDLDKLGELAIQSQADSLAYLTLNQSHDQPCQTSATEVIQGLADITPTQCNLALQMSDLGSIVNPTSPLLRKQMPILEANQQLSAYSVALTELANASSKIAIQQNAIELTGALSSLNDRYLDLRYATDANGETIILTKQQAFRDNEALIATTIAGFAQTITEQKRRSALKEIVNQAQLIIEQLIPAIIAELEYAQLHQSMATFERSALTDAISRYNQTSAKKAQKPTKAAASIQEFHQRYLEIQAAALKDQQMITAFKQIATSHREIAQEINKNRFSSKEIISSISALNKEYQQLHSFKTLLASCQGNIVKNKQGFLICKS